MSKNYLSDFNFTIYRTGISNTAADALSQNPEEDTSNSDIEEDNHTVKTQHELLRIVGLLHTLSLPSMLITAMDRHVQTKSVFAAIEEVQICSFHDLTPEHLLTEASSTNGWLTLQKYNHQWFTYKSFSSFYQSIRGIILRQLHDVL